MSFALRNKSSFSNIPGLSSNSSSLVAAQGTKTPSQPEGYHAYEGQNGTHLMGLSGRSDIQEHLYTHSRKTELAALAPPLETFRLATMDSGSSSPSATESHGKRENQAEQEGLDELEEGELDDSQQEDNIAQQNCNLDRTNFKIESHRDILDKISDSTSVVTRKFHSANFHQHRKMAMAFIEASGLSYIQLAEEGLDRGMLESIYQESGKLMQPKSLSARDSSDTRHKVQQLELQHKSIESQSAEVAKREQYLARLKALQRKSPRKKDGGAGNPNEVSTLSGKLGSEETQTSSKVPDSYEDSNSVNEASAISQRKERLARLREEALKSAKAAQARKELAATRAGQFLDENFGIHAPQSSASFPMSSTMKRSLESEDDCNTSLPLKRPFGQPRFEEGRDGCIIEASDEEAESDIEKSASNLAAAVEKTCNMLSKSHQPNDSLEIHEQKISEMREKIKALEQKSRYKNLPTNIYLLSDNKPPSTELLKCVTTNTSHVPVSEQGAVSTGTSETDAHDCVERRPIENESSLLVHVANSSISNSRFARLQQHMREMGKILDHGEVEMHPPTGDVEQSGMGTGLMLERSLEKLRSKENDQHMIPAQDMLVLQGKPLVKIPNLQDERFLGNNQHNKKNEHTRMGIDAGNGAPESESSMSISEDESLADENINVNGSSKVKVNDLTSDPRDLYESPEITAIQAAEQNTITSSHDQFEAPYSVELFTTNVTESEQLENMNGEDHDKNENARTTNFPINADEQSPLPSSKRNARDISRQDSGSCGTSLIGDSIYGESISEPQLGSGSNLGQLNYASDYSLSPMPEEDTTTNVPNPDEHMAWTIRNASPSVQRVHDSLSNAKEHTGTSSDVSLQQIDLDEDYEPAEISSKEQAPTELAHGLASHSTASHSVNDLDQNRGWNEDSIQDIPVNASQHQHLKYGEGRERRTLPSGLLNPSQVQMKRTNTEGHLPDLDDSSKALSAGQAFFRPYESPLQIFRSYQHTLPLGQESSKNAAPSKKTIFDSSTPLCPFELAGGTCNDLKCRNQHFRSTDKPDASS